MSVRGLFLFAMACGVASCANSSVITESSCNDLNSPTDPVICHSIRFELGPALIAKNVIYRRERLGKSWLLQLRNLSGTNIERHSGVVTDEDVYDVISKALNFIKKNHNGVLNEIQIDITLLDSLWSDQVSMLRRAPIQDDYIVEGKSKLISDIFIRGVAQSTFVDGVCAQVVELGGRCAVTRIGLNPIIFKDGNVGKPWGEIKALPDAGIQKDMVWFSIRLQ